MVSPNWPSEDDPDYTPDFGDRDGDLSLEDPPDRDLEELREDLEDIVDDE